MMNNTKEIFYAIYSLITIVTFEANDQDTLVDFIHFSLKIQVDPSSYYSSIFVYSFQSQIIQSIPTIYYSIHALIAAYLNLMSKLYKITDFSNHVDQVNSSLPPPLHHLSSIFRLSIHVKNKLRIFFLRMLFVTPPPRIQTKPFQMIVSFPKR